MAGSSVTQTNEQRGPIGVITLTATADDTDGSFPTTVIATRIGGKLLALETNPGATGPTDNYDIAITDGDVHDVLEAVGANRDIANSEKVAVVYAGTEIHPVVAKSDVLTLAITNNAVNDAVTVIKLYYEGTSEG